MMMCRFLVKTRRVTCDAANESVNCRHSAISQFIVGSTNTISFFEILTGQHTKETTTLRDGASQSLKLPLFPIKRTNIWLSTANV